MIKATIDRPKLERSLKYFAKKFGETTAQAVVRWSVQSCRELALETQVWGRTGTRKKQIQAILADSYKVLLVVDELKPTPKGFRVTNQGKVYHVSKSDVCLDAQSVNDWIEINRTGRNGRAPKNAIPITERKVCTRAVHGKAMRERYKRAGIAKGGWLGAGQDIARAQTGQEKILIGKSYMAYAQKHVHFGSAKKPSNGWKPVSSITNKSGHSGSKHVLSSNAPKKAIDFGLSKTIKWYKSTLRALDKTKTR